MTMVRKQIYVKKGQAIKLKRQARKSQITEAELIRKAIDRQTAVHVKPELSIWRKERAFIERLIARGPVQGKRIWRREDLYDRGAHSR